MLSGIGILGIVLVVSSTAALGLWSQTNLEARGTTLAFRTSAVIAFLSLALGFFVATPTIQQVAGGATAGIVLGGVLAAAAGALYTVRQAA